MKIKKKIENIDYDNFIEQYLKACGVNDIEHYLNPDKDCFDWPFDYIDMQEAVTMLNINLEKAYESERKFGIVVDSDADGTCSASIMYMFLKSYANIEPILYFHNGKQHGIHDVIDDIIKDGIEFLIVPDAGTNDVEDCRLFKDNILDGDILILDHHEILEENPYAIVVNNQHGNVNKALSGAGVTYKFVQAFCLANKILIPDYRDIVAISIVSDVCDLTVLENRAFIYYGLNNIKNPFLKTLFETVCKYQGVNPAGIGWEIAPLVNALGRMNEQEYKSFFLKCLTGDIEDFQNAIKEMRRIKRKQDTAVKEVTQEIENNVDTTKKVIIGFTEPENKEFIGLIANKFTGKYKKPTILLREMNSTNWSGSLRSPVELLETINNSKLASCMGHGAACGIVVKKANFNKFVKFLEDLDLEKEPEFDVAGELNPEEISLDFAQKIEDNKILWGKGLENPKFYVHLENPSVDIFKKSMTTVKLTQNNAEFIKFFATEDMENQFSNLSGRAVNLIIELKTNEYNGVKTPQGNIIEWEIVDKKEEKEEFDWDSIFV